jgi:two-component system phosphate regulon sensor histidine kinase PhoR
VTAPLVSLLPALAGLLAGLLLGWLLGRRSPAGRQRREGLARASLLGWLQSAPVGWLIVDQGSTVHLINARAEQLLEVPGAALPSQQPLAAICAAPELRELVANTRQRHRIQRLCWQRHGQEIEFYGLPGRSGWVAVVLLSRRSLEAQLEQQERWVSDVAHELRTPLTALLLVGDSLAAQVNSRNAVLVERLQRELLRLQELVNDLLELSRLENALPSPEAPRPLLDLEALVEQAWSGLRPLADPRGVVLELLLLPQGEPAPQVRADRSRLHRLIYNLLDNALRYSPDHSSISVTLRSGGRWCELRVRDRGPGLSAEDQERLFERFYRGDPSRARSRRGGSGLGLAIVRQIALTHGGRVQAGNHPEGGAQLELLLPLPG